MMTEPVLLFGYPAQAITAFFSALSFLLAGAALWVAARNLKNVVNNMRVSTINTAIRYLLEDKDLRAERRKLFDGKLRTDPAQLDEAQFDKLWGVATMHDRYVAVGMVDDALRDDLIQFQCDEIRMTWEKLKPFIYYVREKKKRPSYCKDLEDAYDYGIRKGIIKSIGAA